MFNVNDTNKRLPNLLAWPTSWARNALVQPQPRQAFARLLVQGWTDAWLAVHPTDKGKKSSFLKKRSKKLLNLALDVSFNPEYWVSPLRNKSFFVLFFKKNHGFLS
jgi:hypothetical protein